VTANATQPCSITRTLIFLHPSHRLPFLILSLILSLPRQNVRVPQILRTTEFFVSQDWLHRLLTVAVSSELQYSGFSF